MKEQSNKNIFVYADWVDSEHQLIGILSSSVLRGKEIFSFEYNAQWLNNSDIRALDYLHLILILSERWQRIRTSNMCYTKQPSNLVNQLCLEIAKSITATEPGIIPSTPNTSPYSLLMPSLEQTVDIYGDYIDNLNLHEFVLSDNERVYIPISQCLHQASVSEEGYLKQVVELDGGYPELTPSEITRVAHHSEQASAFYRAVIDLNTQRLLGDEISAKLTQLARALRGGGVHASGSEYNAGSEANLGIIEFAEYWEGLSEQKKSAILTEEPPLQDNLGRLFRPNDVDYQDTRFCVELLAGALDPIIDRFNAKSNIKKLNDRVLEQETLFNEAAKIRFEPAKIKHDSLFDRVFDIFSSKNTNEQEINSCHDLVLIQNNKPPKHILHLIFKLNASEQKVLFKQQGYANALIYALAHEPETLSDFVLNEKDKKQAITVTINDESALIIAAKQGVTNTVNLLINWGAKIEFRDSLNNTALHWACKNGHVDVLNSLLPAGAQLEAKGEKNNTALNCAVFHGKAAVVNLLLGLNANMTTRNTEHMNALDLAIQNHAELIEPILMHLARLPADLQVACLLNAPDGPYPNVLFFAAANKPDLFDALVHKIVNESSGELRSHLLSAANDQGSTPLMLAAQMGAHESILKILDSDININAYDSAHNTALHWACINGDIDTINYLLSNGADLEAQGQGRNTALHCAAMHGKAGAVELLLFHMNANINVRNDEQKNALDLVIERHPNLIKLILIHLVTCSVEIQMECLLTTPDGPYPNVLFYAASHHADLFNALVDRIVTECCEEIRSHIFNASDDKGYTPLILAAQLGAHTSIPKIITSVININEYDINLNTALHWAISESHINAVQCLLDNNADIEATGEGGNTALNFAVMSGNAELVKLILENKASINARNTAKMNALDIAIQKKPELVEPLLMHLALLPLVVQAVCLLKVPNGPYPNVLFPYPNVLFFAAQNRPLLFEALVRKIAIESSKELRSQLFSVSNDKEYTPLILAAQLGLHESISYILLSDVDIKAYDLANNTALHWASINGHIKAVECLLENKADLEAIGSEGNSALNFAVLHGKLSVVELLLKMNANINLRNTNKMNALDLAIQKHPELIDPILMHLAGLPEDVQATCLSKAPQGTYPNVLFFAAVYSPSLFDALVHKIVNESANKDSIAHILSAPNDKGSIPLILAAQIGAHKSIRNILMYSRTNDDGRNALDLATARNPEWRDLILEILLMLPTEKQAEYLFNMPGGPYNDIYDYAAIESPTLLNRLIRRSSTNTKEMQAILDKMHFDYHLKEIHWHYQQMKEKSLKNPNYIAATLEAKTLLIQCNKAKFALFHDARDSSIKVPLFIEACKRAINTAKPVLEQHRELGHVISAFLLAIMTFPISLALYALGLFSVKTKSAQLLDKLWDHVDKPVPSIQHKG